MSLLLTEVVDQGREPAEEQDSAVLLADAARPASTALHRHEQHDHAENIAEHGGGGLRLHVTPHCPKGRQDDGLITLGDEKTKDETIDRPHATSYQEILACA